MANRVASLPPLPPSHATKAGTENGSNTQRHEIPLGGPLSSGGDIAKRAAAYDEYETDFEDQDDDGGDDGDDREPVDTFGFQGTLYRPVGKQFLQIHADRLPFNAKTVADGIPSDSRIIPSLVAMAVSKPQQLLPAPRVSRAEHRRQRKELRRGFAEGGIDVDYTDTTIEQVYRAPTFGIPSITLVTECGAWAQHYEEPVYDFDDDDDPYSEADMRSVVDRDEDDDDDDAHSGDGDDEHSDHAENSDEDDGARSTCTRATSVSGRSATSLWHERHGWLLPLPGRQMSDVDDSLLPTPEEEAEQEEVFYHAVLANHRRHAQDRVTATDELERKRSRLRRKRRMAARAALRATQTGQTPPLVPRTLAAHNAAARAASQQQQGRSGSVQRTVAPGGQVISSAVPSRRLVFDQADDQGVDGTRLSTVSAAPGGSLDPAPRLSPQRRTSLSPGRAPYGDADEGWYSGGSPPQGRRRGGPGFRLSDREAAWLDNYHRSRVERHVHAVYQAQFTSTDVIPEAVFETEPSPQGPSGSAVVVVRPTVFDDDRIDRVVTDHILDALGPFDVRKPPSTPSLNPSGTRTGRRGSRGEHSAGAGNREGDDLDEKTKKKGCCSVM